MLSELTSLTHVKHIRLRQDSAVIFAPGTGPLYSDPVQVGWRRTHSRLSPLQLPIRTLLEKIGGLVAIDGDKVMPPRQREYAAISAAILIPLFALFLFGGTTAGTLLALVAYVGLLASYFKMASARTQDALRLKRRRLAELDRDLWAKRHVYLRYLARAEPG